MKRYCINCGKKAAPEHRMCIHCGKPIPIPDEQKTAETDAKATEQTNDKTPKTDENTIEQTPDETEDFIVDPSFDTTEQESFPNDTIDEQGPEIDLMAEEHSPEIKTPTQQTRPVTATTSGTSEQVETQGASTQQPSSKKNQFIWRIGIISLVILIALFTWGKKHTSIDAVKERFMKAVDEQNVSKVQKMLSHADRSNIETFEAEAFLELVKQHGRGVIDDLTEAVYDGKFLFIFDSYKIVSQDQVAFDDYIADVTYTFNGQDVPIFEEDEDNIAFGPLTPGIYNVEATLKNDFGEFSVEETVILDNTYYQDYTYMGIYLPIDEVNIYVENVDDIGHENITVKINDQEFPVDEEGDTGPIGMMLLNGTVEATVIAKFPWGTTESATFPIHESVPFVYATYVNDEHIDSIKELLNDFSEQYVEAKATENLKVIKDGSDSVKTYIENRFWEGYAYTGEMKKIGLLEDGAYTEPSPENEDELMLYLPVRFIVNEDDHSFDKEPELSEHDHNLLLGLTYNSEKKTWFVENIYTFEWHLDTTHEWNVSGKLYKPDSETVEKASQANKEKEIENFLVDYTMASVAAINRRDFSIVEPYITENGPRRKEAKDYIDYLDSKDIYEEYIDSEIVSVKELDKNNWEIVLEEEFEIIRPDSSDQWRFETKIIVKEIDGEFLVDELISTDRTED